MIATNQLMSIVGRVRDEWVCFEWTLATWKQANGRSTAQQQHGSSIHGCEWLRIEANEGRDLTKAGERKTAKKWEQQWKFEYRAARRTVTFANNVNNANKESYFSSSAIDVDAERKKLVLKLFVGEVDNKMRWKNVFFFFKKGKWNYGIVFSMGMCTNSSSTQIEMLPIRIWLLINIVLFIRIMHEDLLWSENR